jgi:hypothetical protein
MTIIECESLYRFSGLSGFPARNDELNLSWTKRDMEAVVSAATDRKASLAIRDWGCWPTNLKEHRTALATARTIRKVWRRYRSTGSFV